MPEYMQLGTFVSLTINASSSYCVLAYPECFLNGGLMTWEYFRQTQGMKDIYFDKFQGFADYLWAEISRWSINKSKY